MAEEGGAADSPDDECGSAQGVGWNAIILILLFTLVMGLAGSVDIDLLRAQFHRKKGIFCGLLCQFFVMPAAGFIVALIAQPEDHVSLMLMIVCSSSGGAYSNWWCSLFNADLALSVAMTAVSTLVSVAMLPLNLMVYLTLLEHGQQRRGQDVDLPWGPIFLTLATVTSAILTGTAISTKWPLRRPRMQALGNIAGICLISITAAASMVGTGDGGGADSDKKAVEPPWRKQPGFYAVVAAPFVIAMVASVLISSMRCMQLQKPERLTLVIEVGYQNIGVASAVGVSAFCDDAHKRSDAVAVPLCYGVVQAVCIGLICVAAWKADWTYAPSKASVGKILRADFQPKAVTPQESDLVPEINIDADTDFPDAEGNAQQITEESAAQCAGTSAQPTTVGQPS